MLLLLTYDWYLLVHLKLYYSVRKVDPISEDEAWDNFVSAINNEKTLENYVRSLNEFIAFHYLRSYDEFIKVSVHQIQNFLNDCKKCNQNSRLVDKSQKADNGKTPKMVQASTDSFKSLELKHQDPLTAQTLTSKVNFGINHVSNMQIFGI